MVDSQLLDANWDIAAPLLLLLLSLVVAFLRVGNRRLRPFPDHFDEEDVQALAAWNEAKLPSKQHWPLDLAGQSASDRRPLAARILVWGGLVIGIVLLHALVTGLLGAVFETSTDPAIPLMATLVVALLVPSLRERLQRAVTRLVYGERDDPYAALARLGRRLEASLAPEAVLPAVAQDVREALKLPYAAVALRQGTACPVIAAAGDPEGTPLVLPLTYQGEPIGQLLLSPRSPGEPFSPADRRLLDDLARQVGAAAHAVRLTAELQRARERLVTAREEERRRLRRDLHDGLGPQLAALHLQLGTLCGLIEHDPPGARALADELRRELRTAVSGIRRLVNGLRPPALDELGLVGALQERVRQYSAGGIRAATDLDAPALRVVVEAPDDLPALPAALEVAAYRIVEEALTNVVRHARAHACTVRLALADGTLELTVTDDGLGLPAGPRPGVGLGSMHERAAELGGTCTVGPAPGRGTAVRVRLPLPKEDSDGTTAHSHRR